VTKKSSASGSGSPKGRNRALRLSRTAAKPKAAPLANQLHARYPTRIGEYAQLPIDKHAKSGYYLQHVQGTARGGSVKWVKGVLLAPTQPIPPAPPAHAAEAILARDPEGHTHYAFTSLKKRERPHSGLGPVQPGALMRLVTWVCFESAAPPRGKTTSARRTARRKETIVLSDELSVFQCGEASDTGGAMGVAMAALAAPTSTILEPASLASVPMNPAGPTVQCKIKINVAAGPKLTRIQAQIYRTRAEAFAAQAIRYPPPGNVTSVSPAADTASCEAPGAQLGASNWLVAWAQFEGVIGWTVCDGSVRQFTVT
jgi:hypothetical protein